MNNKKLGMVVLIALLAIVSVGSVSAFDLFNMFGGNDGDATQDSINGISFNVPAGFKELPEYESVNITNSSSEGVEFTYSQKVYQNDDADTFSVTTSHYADFEVTNDILAEMGGELRTVNDRDGYFADAGNGFYTYSYEVNGDLVVISTNVESILNQIVI